MKKIIIFVLIVSFVFSFTGCDSKPEPETDVTYYYYVDTLARVLYKVNVETGRFSPVCEDPLCRHSNGELCKYAEVQSFTQRDHTFLFLQDGGRSEGSADLRDIRVCGYDMEARALSVYDVISCTSETSPAGGLEIYDGYVYYYYNNYVDGEFSMSLRRVNVETGEREELGINTKWVPVTRVNDRLYHSNGQEIYHTDLLYNDKQTVLSASNHHRIALKAADEKGNLYYLETQMDESGEEIISTFKKYDIATRNSTIITTIDEKNEQFAFVRARNDTIYYVLGKVENRRMTPGTTVYVWSEGTPKVFYESEYGAIMKLDVFDSYVAVVCNDPEAKPDPEDPTRPYSNRIPVIIKISAQLESAS